MAIMVICFQKEIVICFNLKTEKIMKKQYISPEVLCQQIHLDRLLGSNSITGVDNGDLTHDIETGGSAGAGQDSDSRRRSVWDDEEEDEY